MDMASHTVKFAFVALLVSACFGQNQINQGTQIKSTTGTGASVLATSPTFVTPNIGAATATSLVDTGAETSDGYGCLQIDASGNVTNTGIDCGTTTTHISGTPQLITSSVATTSTTYVTTGISLPTVPISTTAIGQCLFGMQESSAVALAWQIGFTLDNASASGFLLGENNSTSSSGYNDSKTQLLSASGTYDAMFVSTGGGVANSTMPVLLQFVVVTTSSNTITPTISLKSSSSSYTVTMEPYSYCMWVYPGTI